MGAVGIKSEEPRPSLPSLCVGLLSAAAVPSWAGAMADIGPPDKESPRQPKSKRSSSQATELRPLPLQRSDEFGPSSDLDALLALQRAGGSERSDDDPCLPMRILDARSPTRALSTR